MIWLTAVWAAPPAGVEPDDIERWQASSQQVLNGPPGCWIFTGRIASKLVGTSSASRTARGAPREDAFVGSFEGLLQDGVWQNLSYTLHPADRPTEPAQIDIVLLPTVGKFSSGVQHRTNPAESSSVSIGMGDGAASNLIADVFDEVGGSGTADAAWRDDPGAVVLNQHISLTSGLRGDPAVVRTVFPGGGPASRLDVTFPRRVRGGEFPLWVTIYDLQLHLQTAVVDGAVVPAADTVSFGIGVLGMTFGFEQALTWEGAARCTP
jgi:hypothetical protein